jgi:hypothetical protein
MCGSSDQAVQTFGVITTFDEKDFPFAQSAFSSCSSDWMSFRHATVACSFFPRQVLAVLFDLGVTIMWLSGTMRQTFAIGGLTLSAIFAYVALENTIFIVPAVLCYGLTKLGIHLIPWRG